MELGIENNLVIILLFYLKIDYRFINKGKFIIYNFIL